jgi:hypothetical protein
LPPRRRCQKFGNDYHLVAGCRWWPPWEAVSEVWEHPPSMQKTLMAGPLVGDVGGSGAPTINAKNVDNRSHGRRCWRSRSAHHQYKKYRWRSPWEACWRPGNAHHQYKKHRQQAPWEAVSDVGEHPTSTQKSSMTGPWEAVLEVQECPPSTQKTSMTGPLGGDDGGPGASTISTKTSTVAPWEVVLEV